MQNRDIEFTAEGKVILSRETYEELRMFCRMHGETDLPAFPNMTGGVVAMNKMPYIHENDSREIFIPKVKVEYSTLPKEVKKLTDE